MCWPIKNREKKDEVRNTRAPECLRLGGERFKLAASLSNANQIIVRPRGYQHIPFLYRDCHGADDIGLLDEEVTLEIHDYNAPTLKGKIEDGSSNLKASNFDFTSKVSLRFVPVPTQSGSSDWLADDQMNSATARIDG